MNRKKFFTVKTLTAITSCLFILSLPVLGILTSISCENSSFAPLSKDRGPLRLTGRLSAPEQDTDGYYLLRTPKDFRWFTSTINAGNDEINVRLCNDLILNDTSDWEC